MSQQNQNNPEPKQEGGAPAVPPAPPAKPGLPEDILPEQLRGRPAAEVKMILNNLTTAVQRSNREKEELQRRLEEFERRGQPQQPAEPEKPLAEALLESPEDVIARVVEQRFGSRFGMLEQNVGETVFATVSREFEDFSEYESTVREILQESGAPATRENILGAYTLAVGQKTLEQRRNAVSSAANPEIPAPGGDSGDAPEYKLSSLEQEMRQAMGMSEKDWVEMRDNNYEIEVPTGD